MTQKEQKGFTLIELMVVASVISVLASTILVSLNGARLKARNVRIVEETNQLRNAIEQSWDGTKYTDFTPSNYAANTSSYVASNSFVSDPSVVALITDITAQNGGQYGGGGAGASLCSPATTVYNVGNGFGYGSDGIAIFVNSSCGSVTKYAIYSSYAPPTGIQLAFSHPIIASADAAAGPPNPNGYAGYYCVDSSGNSTTTSYGYIPGWWPGQTSVKDGLCH